jgi:hypothetical protein
MSIFKTKIRTKKRQNLRFILAGGAILIVGQIVFNVYLWQRSRPTSDGVIENLVIHAIEGLLNPLPVDAQSGRGYVVSARLVLPVTAPELTGLMYSYSPAVDGSPAELHFTTNTIMSAAKSKLLSAGVNPARDAERNVEAALNQVPNLQACARGIRVVIDKPLESTSGALKDVGNKKLGDGRTMYLYSETGCAHDSINTLAQYIKQVESY